MRMDRTEGACGMLRNTCFRASRLQRRGIVSWMVGLSSQDVPTVRGQDWGVRCEVNVNMWTVSTHVISPTALPLGEFSADPFKRTTVATVVASDSMLLFNEENMSRVERLFLCIGFVCCREQCCLHSVVPGWGAIF